MVRDFTSLGEFEEYCWDRIAQLNKQLDAIEADLERDAKKRLRKSAHELSLPADANPDVIAAAQHLRALSDDPLGDKPVL